MKAGAACSRFTPFRVLSAPALPVRPRRFAAMKCVDFVCYTSKLCNLRCRYCYELPLLSDKRRMELPQIEALFAHVAEHYAQCDEPLQLRFQWHGGEPLLIEPDFYWRVFELQQRAFAGRDRKSTRLNSSHSQ